MFLSFLACFAMQAPPGDVLVVDGWAVGRLVEAKWDAPQAAPSRVSLRQVGIGHTRPLTIDAVLEKTGEGTVETADKAIPGVYFSGDVGYPAPVYEELKDRTAGLAAAIRYARSKEVSLPRPYIVHVWNVDLMGDGSRQQIIEAVSNPAVLRGKGGDGDWQAVLLRWVENGRERVVDLQSSFSLTEVPPARCRVRAVADFDGSGTMEIVTSSDWTEGKNVTLWSFKGQKPLPLVDLSLDRRPARPLFDLK